MGSRRCGHRGVDRPFGQRPVRVTIDPSQDGADVALAVLDQIKGEALHGVGLSELLKPAHRK